MIAKICVDKPTTNDDSKNNIANNNNDNNIFNFINTCKLQSQKNETTQLTNTLAVAAAITTTITSDASNHISPTNNNLDANNT